MQSTVERDGNKLIITMAEMYMTLRALVISLLLLPL